MTTYADILTLANGGTTSINLSDNKTVLTAAQAQTLIGLGVSFAANDVVKIEDTASVIEALTATEITALKGLGASQVLANDRAMTLDIAQIQAFAAADLPASSQYETMSPTTTGDILVGSTLYSFLKGMTPVGLADGSYVVMFKPSTSLWQIVVQAFDASGNATGTNVVAVDTDTTFTELATISALACRGVLPSGHEV